MLTTLLANDGEVMDERALERTIERLREARVTLPTFGELADPGLVPARAREGLAGVGPDDADPLNLFRVHWYNAANRVDVVDVPEHLVLPPELTGVEARIVVALGDRFPLIAAHKVLAAYGCLVPLLVSGRFDPTDHRAVWPSTGNYCRGGVAISRLLGCRGVAVLPEGMSRERFDWLAEWVVDRDEDIVRTPGTESNVKEIYDACKELALDERNVILNQFAEFGNYLVHYLATGAALERVFEHLRETDPGLELRAFVAATGSAGTIAAGDYLKGRLGSRIVACEPVECPTLLYNGFGSHNIQGIGDKHVPLIHNVMNTDVVLAVSDRATDRLGVLFGTDAGRAYLSGRGVPDEIIHGLPSLGLSSICNVLGAIKTAKYLDLGPDDVVVTVATDGAPMYHSERDIALDRYFPGGLDEVAAAEVFGEHLLGTATDHVLELGHVDRKRIFNLGYFTWVEQQGVSIEDFEARRDQAFWARIAEAVPAWDSLIEEINTRVGVVEST